MLKNIPITLLTSSELVATADRIVSAIDEPLAGVFQNRIKKIKEASTQLTMALNKDRSSDYTPMLAEADQQRDDAYLALKHGVLSATYRPGWSAAGSR